MTALTVLALVRHGESEWVAQGRFQGRGDSPLTELGIHQATALGARLAAPSSAPSLPVPDTPPVAIWHSPLRRALQTAQAIHEAREADAPLRPLDSLTELAQGEWEGLTHDQVRERYPEQLAAWRADPVHNHAPGGESLPEALERVREARAAILGETITGRRLAPDAASVVAGIGVAPAEPVLGYERTFKGASSPSWAIVAAHDGVLRLLMLDLLGIGIAHFWAFPFSLAGVSVLDLADGLARLRAHNLDEHVGAVDRRHASGEPR